VRKVHPGKQSAGAEMPDMTSRTKMRGSPHTKERAAAPYPLHCVHPLRRQTGVREALLLFERRMIGEATSDG
jgi:hypothetical protein